MFPRLRKFLGYWRSNLDGPLLGVRIAHAKLLTPREVHCVSGELLLN